MNRIVHFEIQASDIERAAAFYTTVFGWKIEQWPGMEYWVIMMDSKDSPHAAASKDSKEPGLPAQTGINGGMLKRPCDAPGEGQGLNAFACTIQVVDIDATLDAVLRNGGKMAMPKFALPGVAWQAYCIDTEGNTFGVHQADPNAK